MGIQSDVGEVIAYKKQTVLGTLPGASGAQALRRTEYNLALTKALLATPEIRSDYQKPLPRHGRRGAAGPVQGVLSGGTYAPFIAACLARDFAAVANIGPLATVTASASAPHFVRGSGSWITDGLRVGMVVRWSGWAAPATANNSKNYTITALTATGITVAETVTAKAAGDSVTLAVPGKSTYTPDSGHSNDIFTFERWMPDAGVSLRAIDVRVGSFGLELGDDNVGYSMDLMGTNVTRDTSAYFTSPTVEGTSRVYSALGGALYIGGTAVGVLSGFSLKADRALSPLKTVFTNVSPDVRPGAITVSGSLSAYLDSPTNYGYFDDETTIQVVGRFDADATGGGHFFAFALPAVTIAGGSVQRQDNALMISFDFQAGKGDGANGWQGTTLQVQDSLAA